jgi:hypothetical protein
VGGNGSGAGGEEGADRWGPHVSGRKKKKDLGEGRNLAEKAHSAEEAKGVRANWADDGGRGLQRESGLAWRTGLAGPDSGEDSIENFIFEFQMNLEFGRTLKK